MECHKKKNFNVVAGLVPSFFIDQTFSEMPKIRKRIFVLMRRDLKLKKDVGGTNIFSQHLALYVEQKGLY